MRREGLYSSHIVEWRRAREVGALGNEPPMPRRSKRSAEQAEIERLKRKNERLESQLAKHRQALEIQGKASEALSRLLAEATEETTQRPEQPEAVSEACFLRSSRSSARAPRAWRSAASRATHYRRRRPGRVTPRAPRPAPPNKLSESEVDAVLGVLRSHRFVDCSPAQVYFTLLDEGIYLASESTYYRLLRENGEVRERRAQATHPPKKRPELVATRAEHLLELGHHQAAGTEARRVLRLLRRLGHLQPLRRRLVRRRRSPASSRRSSSPMPSARHRVPPGQLTIHADRGSSMTSNPVVELYTFLGIKRSHSRPHVSNDNPYSEAGFKTMKYCPAFPGNFGSIEDARAFVLSVLQPTTTTSTVTPASAYHTPASVHFGTATEVRAQRAETLGAAYETNPARFRHRRPEPPELPTDRLDQRAEHRGGGTRAEGVIRPCLIGLDRFRDRHSLGP